LSPASIGTSCPASSPICRLKKGSTSAPVAGNAPAFQARCWQTEHPRPFQKERALSGNSSEKRVRLIWRASTSSPKSVLNVAVSLRLGVML
jgi:hypothetical protein